MTAAERHSEPAASVSARRRRTHGQVLAVLAEHGALSRADLSRITGLSRSAIASTVTLLAAEGLVTENTPATTGTASRGRRPTVVTLRRRHGIVLAIDFGHAHITTAVATTSGDLLAESTEVLDVDSHPQQALDTVTGLAARALAEAGRDRGEITGIAAGIPGPLDIRTQVVRAPTILRQWIGLNPADDEPSLAELAIRPEAARVITEAGRTLGLVLSDLVNCLNPAAIVLGGDLNAAGEPLAEGVRESINRYAQPASARAVAISISGLRQRSELLGAMATAIQQTAIRQAGTPI